MRDARAVPKPARKEKSPKIAIKIQASFFLLLLLLLPQLNESVQEAGGYRGQVYE